MTLKDIAAEVGISIATASLAIRDDERISEETKRRVWDAQLRLGYIPGGKGAKKSRKTKQKKLTRVAFILLDRAFDDFNYFSHFHGFAQAASAKGFDAVYFALERDEVANGRLPLSLRNGEIGGIVVSGCHDAEIHLIFQQLNIPMVVLGNYELPSQGLASCEIDTTSAITTMLNHMAEFGHRKIGIFHETMEIAVEKSMRAQYLLEVERLGLSTASSLTQVISEVGSVKKAARAALSAKERPTAVIVTNRNTAAPIYDVAHELGLEIPGDLSVGLIGTIEAQDYFRPALTVVGIKGSQLGIAAFEKLARMAAEGDCPTATREIFQLSLIKKASIAPPRDVP